MVHTEFVTAAATTAWGAAAVSANRASTVASYTGSAENYFGFIWRWHVAQLLNGRAGRLLDALTQLLSSPNHSSRGRKRCSPLQPPTHHTHPPSICDHLPFPIPSLSSPQNCRAPLFIFLPKRPGEIFCNSLVDSSVAELYSQEVLLGIMDHFEN